MKKYRLRILAITPLLLLALANLGIFTVTLAHAADIKPALVETFGNEGGYTVDSGGPTNFGISQKAYPYMSTAEIKALTLDKAAAIYHRDYWDVLGLDKEPSQITANELFDSAVNEGTGTVARRIQKAINLANYPRPDIPVDGKLGPETWAAKAKVNPVEFYVCLIGLRFGRYQQLVEKNPEKYDQYFKSWVFRIKNNVARAVHEYDAYRANKQVAACMTPIRNMDDCLDEIQARQH